MPASSQIQPPRGASPDRVGPGSVYRMASPRRLVCPWCGHLGPADATAPGCEACGGGFDPESRRESQNEMGPWFVRDPARPFAPGCSYERLVRRIDAGEVRAATIIRGPTTRQLWAAARRVPAVAHLLGYCHACGGRVPRGAERCGGCGTRFEPWLERDRLGLGPVRLDPGDAPDPAGEHVVARPPAATVPADSRSAAGDVRGPSPEVLATTALARRVPDRASPVAPDRVAAIAARLGAEPAASRGIGTWTALIGAMLIVLAGLLLLPLVPRMVSGLRGVAEPAVTEADLPAGAFRSGVDGPGSPPVTGPGDAEPGPPVAPPPAPTAAPPSAEPASGSGESAATDTAADAAPAVRETRPSPASLDLQRLRRLAEDPGASPAQRIGAWRMLGRRLASAIRDGRPIPGGLDAAAVEAGIDRVHLDAFLAGDPPRAAITAGSEPADPHPAAEDVAGSMRHDTPAG